MHQKGQELSRPIGLMPIPKNDAQVGMRSSPKPGFAEEQPQAEKAAFGKPGTGDTFSANTLSEDLVRVEHAQEEDQARSQRHDDQQSLEMLQATHLTLFPMPAIRFQVPESTFDGKTAAIQVDEFPARREITD